MLRVAGSVIAGLITWVLIATLLNFGLRFTIPAYHAAEATLQFTLAMKIGRLVEAAIASVAAGAAVALVAPRSRWAPALMGLIVLGMFLPVHLRLWDKFPIWYHLAFLVPLIPLAAAGGMLPSARTTRSRTAAST
ncbi:hypothetical protein [Sphingomonas agri]|uniref:hypothetical protein n=1 Tax=Sphingomonas agri TaxID=1813878 RepID=UPI00311F23BF